MPSTRPILHKDAGTNDPIWQRNVMIPIYERVDYSPRVLKTLRA